MKRILILFTMCAIALTSCRTRSEWVKVEGNHFVAPDGEELIFRGLCTSDPVKLVREGQWTERYFQEAADWGANVVRFCVHPENINSYGWDKTFELLDQGVEWAKAHGMYVIMDWHSIGNLKEKKFTNAMYDTSMEETVKFWTAVATRYKEEPAVALYELFNEPTVTGEELGDCSWAEWKAILESLIDTIRAINPNAVCLCAGFNWAYDLIEAGADPVARENVAYVSHPYPMKRQQPWESRWDEDFGFIAERYPVICTEIGFCLPEERGAHVPVMDDGSYGPAITDYFAERGISFTVWCFDAGYAPTLFSDWDFTPTTQGKYFKNYLQTNSTRR